MKNMIASFLSIIMLFMLLCITPVYYWSIIDYAKTSTVLLASTRNVIDEVIDTRQLTDVTLEEFTLDLATVSGYYEADIVRKKMYINPGAAPGKEYISYFVVDDNRVYDSGDKIQITVRPVADSYFEAISKTFMGLSLGSSKFTLVGRVR